MRHDTLTIKVLGGIEIYWNQKNVHKKLNIKSTVLLLYLALHPNKEFKRELLAHRFWNGSGEKSARYNLRHALWHIKKIFHGNSPIISNQSSCRISNTMVIESDFHHLEVCHQNMKTLPAQEIDQVVSSYQGHFALNTTLKQASDVNDWLLYMNTYTERLFFETAEHLALCYRKKKAHAKAILLYKRLLQINPYHEQLYLFIMESYLEYNNPNEAMCVYETCQKILRNELNTEPQEELSTLYQSICNRPPSPTITTAPHMLESGATSELSVRVVDIQSQVQYYGLQKLIEPMIEELHHAEAHDNIFQELLPLSCVYPPINRHSRSACIYSTDAGILYCFKILLKRFASLSEIRIEAKGLKKTDSTTRSLIDTLIKEQPLPSCLVFLPEFNS